MVPLNAISSNTISNILINSNNNNGKSASSNISNPPDIQSSHKDHPDSKHSARSLAFGQENNPNSNMNILP